MEEYVIILDYMPNGLPSNRSFKKEPLAYGLGINEFKLFELIPKNGITMTIGMKTYIGKDKEKREHIHSIKRRVGYNELTQVAKGELPFTIIKIIMLREKDFIKFFNDARPITTRFHMLELLPGLGKKTMWSIIEEREKKPFEDFKDLSTRVKSIHHPEKLVAKRIETELTEEDVKYKIFIHSSHTSHK